MSVIDLSMSLSDVLRDSTRMPYEDAEVSLAATTILRGFGQVEVFPASLEQETVLNHRKIATLDARRRGRALGPFDERSEERSLERHQHHPVLEPTYDPALLARAPPLSADIAHLLDVPESSWKAHSIHTQLLAEKPPALEAYTVRIQAIADLPDPSVLLAHSYVRYIGDLSGGQTIQRALAKAYGLTLGGAGLSFYAFKELHSNMPASQSEMKRIRDWFRAGMNKGAGNNVEVKAAVMDEASRVFEFTSEIFKAVNIELQLPQNRDRNWASHELQSFESFLRRL
ncbi:hypothetical protein B0H14DRAFT_3563254 [Mycena olivaceomarginata]|nr:hypothetical protein B0H14DRAFT_3563254 [Mycena olivaceomarginata]